MVTDMLVRFGSFELDAERFELRRAGERVAVQPRVLDTITLLVQRSGGLVTKRDFIAGPWRGAPLSDSALTQAIRQARSAVSEGDHQKGSYIQTVRGKGYRFNAKVQVLARTHEATVSAEASDQVPGGYAVGRAFVGRQAELEKLHAAAAEARAGRGNLVLIHGPPGIGKTRTCEWFTSELREADYETCWGGCREGQSAPPFWPWPEVIGRYGEARDEATLRDLAKGQAEALIALAPELGPLLGLESDPGELSPHRVRQALDAVAGFLRRAAQAGPLVLVLEDLHLADDAALEQLEVLVRSIGDTQLLVVGTCRTTEGKTRPVLTQALTGQLPHTHPLELPALSPADVRQWLNDLSRAQVPDSVVATLHYIADGHPLMLSSLIEVLPSEWQDPSSSGGTAQQLPRRLQQALEAHFDKLDADALEVLRDAAVFGEEFALGVLANSRQSTVQALLPGLERAQSVGLLRPVRQGRQRFAHALQRDLLYEKMAVSEQVERHLRVARAFAEQLAHQPELIGEAAHHFVKAAALADPEEVVRYAERAASWSRQRHAYGVAERYYQEALHALELGAPNARKRAELLVELGRTQFLAGQVETAQTTFDGTFDLCRTHGFWDLFSEALLVIFEMRQETVVVDQAFHERLGQALQHSSQRDVIHAKLQTARALVTVFTTSPADRARWLEQALAIAREAADPQALVEVTRGALRCYTRFSDGTTLLGLADEMLEAARRVHSPEAELEAGQLRAHALLELGRGEDFQRQVTTCVQQASLVQVPQLSCRATGQLGCSAFIRGRLQEAEDLARIEYSTWRELMGPIGIGLFASNIMEIGLQLSKERRDPLLLEVVGLCDQFLALVPAYYIAVVGRARAKLYSHDSAPAAQLLEELASSRTWNLDPEDRNHITLVTYLADIATQLPNATLHSELIQQLRQYGELHSTASNATLYLGPISYWLGRLHLVAGELAEARWQLERAVAESQGARSVIYEAWSEYYLAEALVGSDEQRRQELLASAKRAAERHQLGRLLETMAAAAESHC